MFYILTIFCCGFRISGIIMCVKVSQEVNLFMMLMPCVLKVCIGLVQIAVMIEISFRVKENVRIYTLVNNSSSKRAKNMMNDIIASKNVTKVKILIFQVFVFLVSLVSIIWTGVVTIKKNNVDYAEIQARLLEFKFVEDSSRYLAISFLILFFLLTASVLYLMHQLY